VSAPGYGLLRFPLVPDRDQTVPLALPPAIAPAQLQPMPAVPAPIVAPPAQVQPLTRPPPVQQAPMMAPSPPAMRTTDEAPPSARPVAPPSVTTGTSAIRVAPPSHTNGTVTVHGAGCTVAIDGQIRGRTPITHLLVAPGDHRIICRTGTGAIRSRNVTVAPGLESTISFD
jgi:hypothetical protein